MDVLGVTNLILSRKGPPNHGCQKGQWHVPIPRPYDRVLSSAKLVYNPYKLGTR